ncbi:hypothetical protein GCM10027419_20400 [Pandoraea terrae]
MSIDATRRPVNPYVTCGDNGDKKVSPAALIPDAAPRPESDGTVSPRGVSAPGDDGRTGGFDVIAT